MKNPHFEVSQQFADLNRQYSIVDDLWEGTSAMRRVGTKYLPREPKESKVNYDSRLNKATLEPIFKRTIVQSVGKAFSKSITTNNIPPQLEPMIFNVDQSGTSLEAFSKDVLVDAIKYGITYIISDFPVMEPNATLQDELQAGAYPYFVNIKATHVLDLHVSYIDGIAQLSYFRFLETVVEYEGIKSFNVKQVKEFTFDVDGAVIYNIWRLDKNKKEYLYDTNVITNMKRIPITPVYGNKITPFIGEPTLMDLAYMNIKLYQKTADIDVALHYGAMPMLVLKGVEQNVDPATGMETEIVISPNSGINVAPDGDARWLELNGSGIKTYQEDVKDLKASMSFLGLELTSPNKTIHETATGRILDEHTKNSMLKVITIDLAASIIKAIYHAGQYLQLQSNAEVIIDTSLTVTSDIALDNIVTLVSSGMLTPAQGLEEVKARMLLITDPIIENSNIN